MSQASLDSHGPAASDDELLANSIVVVGAPRSGTKVIGLILRRHPSVAYLSEPRLTWLYGNETHSDALRPEQATPAVKNYIRRTFAGMVREQGGERLIEKTPSNSLRMEFVDAVLPGCKFIHITRDGVNTIISSLEMWQDSAYGFSQVKNQMQRRVKEIRWSRLPYYAKELVRRALPKKMAPVVGHSLWGPRLPGMGEMVRELDLVDVCCLQWRACVEAACISGSKLPPERYMQVRLEDLGPEMFERIQDFCGIEPTSDVQDYVRQKFDTDRAGRHVDKADPELVARIREMIEPTQKWLGYE